MVIYTSDVNETIELGYKIGSLLEEGMVILLEGDLGAGKTTFTKGIGKALGINKTINSPTFTIMKAYKGRLNLYHLDLYRIEKIMDEFDLEEYIDGNGVSVIEWPSQAVELLPKEYLKVIINNCEDKRKFTFSAIGKRYEKLMEELRWIS